MKISVKIINTKNHTYEYKNHTFDDIINIKDFEPSNIEIDEKSNKNILIYYIGYVTIKKDQKNYCVNLLYLILGNVKRYFDEININKHLRHEELRNRVRDLIRSITKSLDDYDEKYMKIKFDSDDNLPLKKTIEIPITTIVARVVFNEVFLD